jgi:hypothetical protein
MFLLLEEQEQISKKQHEMDRSLHDVRATAREGDDADRQSEDEHQKIASTQP